MNSLIVAFFSFIVNVPLGRWRRKYKKFTLPWWLIIHTSVPFIIALRIGLNTPRILIPLFILLAILGQLTGRKANFGKK
jgi:hypothetical protein